MINTTLEQTINLEMRRGDKKFPVAVVIGALTPRMILSYLNGIESFQSHTAAGDLVIETRDEAAGAELFRAAAVRTIGIKTRSGGELSDTENWQEKFLSRYYKEALAIAGELLGMAFKEDQSDPGTEDFIFDDEAASIYRAEIKQSGKWFPVSFEFGPTTAAQSAHVENLNKQKRWRRTGEAGGQSEKDYALVTTPHVSEMLKLYETLVIRTEGFDGEPLPHHKLMAITRHFAAAGELVEKN